MLSRFRHGDSSETARSTRRTSLSAILMAATMGASGTVFDGSMALAAAGDPVKPTIAVTETFVGYGTVVITGRARPGATVYLHEAAYAFRTAITRAEVAYWPNEPQPDIIEAKAAADGTFKLARMLDSGFVFAAEADNLVSNVATVQVRVMTEMSLATSPGTGNVTATVTAHPGEPFLDIELQRLTSGTWTTVGAASTGGLGSHSFMLADQPAGSQSYRVRVNGNPENAMLTSGWAQGSIVVGNSAAVGPFASEKTGPTTSPTLPEPADPAPKPTPTPTKPTPTPTKPTPTPPPTPVKPTPVKPPVNAVGAVQFTKVVYDSPGKDTSTNTSRNGEYVKVTNRTKKTINLRNWTVRDLAGHVYTFKKDLKLGAGKHAYVRTGSGTDGKPSSGYRYWGSRGYIWNNSSDTAYLRDATGKAIDSCRWTKNKNVTSC